MILAAFVFYELRVSKDPVLDLRHVPRRDFTLGSPVTWVTSMVIFGSLILIPIFLEQVRRAPSLGARCRTGADAAGIAAAIAVALSGRLYNRMACAP